MTTIIAILVCIAALALMRSARRTDLSAVLDAIDADLADPSLIPAERAALEETRARILEERDAR